MKTIYTAVQHKDKVENKRIKAFATKQGLSKSNLFRIALNDYSKQHGEDLDLEPLVPGNPKFKKGENK